MTPDLQGKVVLVTGANAGIGKETARALAGMGATVMVHGRSAAKVEAAVEEIRTSIGHDHVEPILADFASLSEVRRLAHEVLARHDRLDVLVNNAGLILAKRQTTADGYEATFAVNHLAPFLLTNLLRERMVESAPARVVTVSSRAHSRKAISIDDVQSANGYFAYTAYGKSKLANILFTRALARRLEETGVTSNCLHPGVVASDFGRGGDTGLIGEMALRLGGLFMITPEKGARTSVYLASSPEVAGTTGEYFIDSKKATPSRAARDDEAGERLWALSEKLTGLAG